MNKLGTKLGAVAMSAVMALTFAPSAAITSLAAGGDDLTDATQLSVPVYRLYNPNSGEHLFTTNENECDSLDKNGWDYETIAWYAPSTGDPVFRLYNPNHPLGDHHYTSSEEERDNLIKQGWKLDATAFNTVAEGELLGAPVYSLYNPNAYDLGMATHHLTLSEEEADGLELLGWTNEGPKFYEYAEDLDPEVEELTVSIDNTTPKVGDTLTAGVVDRNGEDVSDNVTFQWYANDEAIEGATEETLGVTVAMVGSTIKVVATAENGNTFESDETAAVYASLALLSADQTGKSVVTLTTNGPVTALDDIDVFKGTKEVEIDSIDYEDDGAVVTLKNAIVADAEYTVTLTPADEDDEATSATFVGEKAKLDRIEFLNDVLVMKDNTYKEGYAYVKGYDQFDQEVTLSGLTVTPGVGTFKSYDNTTGKITIVDNNNAANATGAFLLIKEVPVFVQYQTGNDVISAQETLTVSSQAYVNELTFGEVEKDGTKRADERLTIDELGSGKYYVEILDVKDQYGDTLDADDLNDQKSDANGSRTLFVIPGDSGAFYQTGDFAELNGKTILWLEPVANGAGKPGTMTLTITGAGGKTFSTDITVEDNPYIQTLSVSYPELYAGSAKSAALEFSAIDQYGDAVDLWDFRPEVDNTGKELIFRDFNNMTQLSTKITISGNAVFNTVVKDAGKKTFTVTLNTLAGGAKARDLITFTEQTAGMQIATKSIAVGEMGTAAKIKSALKSGANLQMDDVPNHANGGTNHSVNFNKFIQFEDANGNEMVRGTSEKYPFYIEINGLTVEETLPQPTNALWTTGKFVWSLTKEQIKDANTASNAGTNVAVTDYDNGTVESADFGAATSLDVYATVYMTDGATYYKLDEKKFHLTSVQGNDKTYTAKAKNTIYCNSDDPKNTEIAVTAKTDSGETYTVDSSRVQVVPKAPFAVTTDNKYTVSGADASGTGTTTATVYVDNNEETTVDISYTDAAPVATKVEKKFNIVNDYVGTDGTEASKVGAKFDGDFTEDSFTLGDNATLTIDGGVLTVTRANSVEDTLTFRIADQYGRAMGSTKFYVDGVKVTANQTVDSSAKDVTIEWANGTLTGKVILEKGGASATLTFKEVKTESVKTESGLKAALLGSADVITVDKNIDLTGALIVPADKTVKIASGVTIDDKGKGITVNTDGKLEVASGASLITTGAIDNDGSMVIDGSWEHSTNTIDNAGGKVTGKGHVVVNNQNITNTNGEFVVTGNTLAILGAVTITDGKLGGHTVVSPGAALTLAGTLTLADKVEVEKNEAQGAGTLKLGDNTSTITLADGLVIDASAGGTITTQTSGVTVETGDSVTLVTNSKDTLTIAVPEDAASDVSDVKITGTGASSASAGDTITNQTVGYAISYTYSGERSTTGLPKTYEDKTGSATEGTVKSGIVSLVNQAVGYDFEEISTSDVAISGKTATVTLTNAEKTTVEGSISYTAANVKARAGSVAVTESLGEATGTYSVAAKTGATNKGTATIDSSTGALDLTNAAKDDEYTITFTGNGAYEGTVTCDVKVLAATVTGTISYTAANVKAGTSSVAVTASLGEATGTYSVAATEGATNSGTATINASTGALDLTGAQVNDAYTITFTGSGNYEGTVTCDVHVLAST